MKKAYHLISNEEFSKVIKKGLFLKNKSYIVHSLSNDIGITRIGISASTKLGHAVTRVRVRRQIRALCDCTIVDYTKNSVDLVIIARQGFLDTTFAENKVALEELLSKALVNKNEK